MKQIAVIHTVWSVASTFGPRLREYLGGNVAICNLWDEYLSISPNRSGGFSDEDKKRLYFDLKNAEQTGADLIVVSCSSLSPFLELFRPAIRVPVVAIDDAMVMKAAACGGPVLVLATALSTAAPTAERIRSAAAIGGRSISVDWRAVPEAFRALAQNDLEKHNQILINEARGIKDYACIVLAQASMEPCADAIAEETGLPVLTSPALCMEEVRSMLAGSAAKEAAR